MSGEINEQRGDAFYADHYRDGGWKYSFLKEYRWHRRQVVKRFSLKRGGRMLEVGCGCGFHTNLFNWMGFDCVGADRSSAGIDWAKAHYPNRTYYCCDFREMPLPPASFDIVLARGFSYYHYDLAGDEAHQATRLLLGYLKPGGVFIMVIASNLSGEHAPRMWHNTLPDYRKHFCSFGKKWSVDWADGMAICALHNEPNDELSAPEIAPQTSTAAP